MDDNNFEEMLRKMQEQNNDTPAEDNSAEENSIFDFSSPAPKNEAPVEPVAPVQPKQPDFLSFMNEQNNARESEDAPAAENPFDFFQPAQSEASQPVSEENAEEPFAFMMQNESAEASLDEPGQASEGQDGFLSFLQNGATESGDTPEQEPAFDMFSFQSQDPSESGDTPEQEPAFDMFSFQSQETSEPSASTEEEFTLSDPIETNAPDDTYFDMYNQESNPETPEIPEEVEIPEEIPQNDPPEDVFGFPIHESVEESEPEVTDNSDNSEIPDDEGVILEEEVPMEEEAPVEEAPVEEVLVEEVLVEEEAPVALADRLVRFPETDYVCRLGDLIDESTGAPLDLDALFPAPAATSEDVEEYSFSMPGAGSAETPSFGAGSFASSTASEGSGSAPRRVVRRAPKKKASAVKLVFGVILGGLLAFPLAHYLGISIQKFIMKTDQPQGIMEIPTPGFPETYRYAKRYSWLPAPVMDWFLDNAVAPPKREEEEEKKESISVQPSEEIEETEEIGETEEIEEVEDFGETEEETNNDFHVDGLDEVEIAHEDDSDLSATFGKRPGEDAAAPEAVETPEAPEAPETVETPEAPETSEKPATVDFASLQTSAKDGTLTASELVALAAQADVLNPQAEATITKENHDQGVAFVGTVVKVATVKGFQAVKVKLDGSESAYFVVSKETTDIAEGAHCAVSGTVKSPESDEAYKLTKDASPVVLRGLLEVLP